MTVLLLAAAIWVGLHLGLAGTRLRDRVAAAFGEGGFRGLFALLSVGAIYLLCSGYNGAATRLLWVAGPGLRWVLAALMLPAFILLVGAFTTPNPTAVGGGAAMAGELRGMQRVTRHPMLWAIALWAAVHILGNGDSASLVFFGAFLVTALAGMPSIDAKLARRDPARWEGVARQTSVLPFGAILAGRNRLDAREIGWLPPLLGLLLWGALLHFHRPLFGVAPLSPS